MSAPRARGADERTGARHTLGTYRAPSGRCCRFAREGAAGLDGSFAWNASRGFVSPERRVECRSAALAVLCRAVALGVDHIDTSQYYGPDVVNELIHEALHPSPDGLRLVTKVGARRDDKGAWLPALRPEELRAASRTTCAPWASSR
jgi:aryl-alcohol dehydrogenase-like predicted oxidoreductase